MINSKKANMALINAFPSSYLTLCFVPQLSFSSDINKKSSLNITNAIEVRGLHSYVNFTLLKTNIGKTFMNSVA